MAEQRTPPGRDLAAWRMRSQRLWGRGLGSIEEVVGHLGAMQAQDYPSAKWSIAQRASGVRDVDVDRALGDGSIIRTHILRPTWHFVRAVDIRWILTATAWRVLARTAARHAGLGLDARTVSRALSVIARGLKGGGAMTRAELSALLARSKIDPAGQRLPHLLACAELEGVIGSGALRGREHTYTLLDERIPSESSVDRREAERRLARRYFESHGPATLRDFTWWSSLRTTDAREAIDAARLERTDVDGRTYWSVGGRVPSPRSSGRLDLVQVYDESVVAYRESRDVTASSSLISEAPGFMHFALLDGREAGRWRRVRTTGGTRLELALRTRVRPAEVERAVATFRRFSGGTVDLRMSDGE